MVLESTEVCKSLVVCNFEKYRSTVLENAEVCGFGKHGGLQFWNAQWSAVWKMQRYAGLENAVVWVGKVQRSVGLENAEVCGFGKCKDLQFWKAQWSVVLESSV